MTAAREWRRGQVVRQRPAKPSPPVRIWASPPTWNLYADMAQLVEHHLAKVRVAGSNPVVRSMISRIGSLRALDFLYEGFCQAACLQSAVPAWLFIPNDRCYDILPPLATTSLTELSVQLRVFARFRIATCSPRGCFVYSGKRNWQKRASGCGWLVRWYDHAERSSILNC